MISVHNLEKSVISAGQRLSIVKGLSLEIKTGESVAIVGASGAGKSTLLGLLAGLDTPDAGEIRLQGELITDMNEDQRAALRARYVGFVFQSFQLLPGMTALENVMLPLELANRRHARDSAMDFLQRVGLAERSSHYPRQLSGGEQQRVALARAFAVQPAILFADEPTGNLDEHSGGHIVDLLFDMNAQSQTTLVLVTHEPVLASRCARVLEMHDGQLSERSPRDAA